MALKHISLKSKLIFMLLSIALSCILIVGYQGLSNGKAALTDRIYSQLTSVRESKRSQITDWFKEMQNHVKALAIDHTVVRAMREFSSSYNRLENNILDDNELNSLKDFYSSTYLPNLQKSLRGKPSLEQYLPSSNASQYLQYQYISSNNHAPGEKHQLDSSEDRTYYSGVHDYYHPVFRSFTKNYDFYDLFLIDLETGNIVYSVAKEPDYATSLKTGPYRTSNVGDLYREVYDTQDLGDVRMTDFDFYRPSNGRPATFMGTTIFDESNNAIGILAIQLPVERLNKVMTGNEGWQYQGLGETGEAFLVGEDYLMRSDVRQLFASDTCYATALAENSLMDETTASKICQLNTSILLQKVDNEAITQALNGESGTQIVTSYSGEETLVAYAPLIINGLKWAINAQINLDEANVPIISFQKELGISTVIIASIVTFLAMTLAYFFTRPISELMQGVRKLSRGDTDVHIELNRNDEYGELAKTFNHTAHLINKQQQQIQQSESEKHRLLLNIMPEKAARQFEHKQQEFAERFNNVSVLYTSLRGFSAYADKLAPQEAIEQLNNLLDSFDNAAEQQGVERVKTVGDSYVAASGLNVSRLDHANRCVNLAMKLIEQVAQFNREHHTELSIRIGIHSGPVVAGVIGRDKFAYDLWGEAIQIASRIRFEGASNSVIISAQTYERLTTPELFSHSTEITTQTTGELTIWVYTAEQGEAATDPNVARLIQPTQSA